MGLIAVLLLQLFETITYKPSADVSLRGRDRRKFHCGNYRRVVLHVRQLLTAQCIVLEFETELSNMATTSVQIAHSGAFILKMHKFRVPSLLSSLSSLPRRSSTTMVRKTTIS